jgi:hypothetical protein
MTDLQRCIAECGTDAPLYTVPSEAHPKPMQAVADRVMPFTLPGAPWRAAIHIPDLKAGTWYRPDGHPTYDGLPAIRPVMPLAYGDIWKRADGKYAFLSGSRRVCTIDGTEETYEIDEWGRAADPQKSLVACRFWWIGGCGI